MMDELKDTLHTGECSLVVLHEGNITTFNGPGVRTLYNILATEPELLLGSKLADKAIGRTAAMAIVEGGVVEVWADMISNQAYDLLADAGIKVECERKVDHTTFLKVWERMGETIA